MSELVIERLALKLSGLTEPQGRHLARLLTETLAARLPAGSAASIGQLQVRVAPSPGEPLETLAERLVAEVLRQLQGSL